MPEIGQTPLMRVALTAWGEKIIPLKGWIMMSLKEWLVRPKRRSAQIPNIPAVALQERILWMPTTQTESWGCWFC